MINWASVINNDDCVKSSVNNLYWEAVEKTETKTDELPILVYLLIGAGVVVTIAGIVLGVLCCRKKNDKHEDGVTRFNE